VALWYLKSKTLDNLHINITDINGNYKRPIVVVVAINLPSPFITERAYSDPSDIFKAFPLHALLPFSDKLAS
jgi:hypothetical protein